jgi:5'-deoxynucleotidase YfbR-like HD superfamily hydrolase
MRRRVEFFVHGAETLRYHTVRTIQSETVGHHSHGVAMYCILLGGSDRTVRAALYHDLAEHILGDIPAPAKKQYGIGAVVNELEDKLLSDFGFGTELDEAEKRAMKLADIFQGMTFCIRERELGNRNMGVVFHRYCGYAEQHVLVGKEREIFDTLKEKYDECE